MQSVLNTCLPPVLLCFVHIPNAVFFKWKSFGSQPHALHSVILPFTTGFVRCLSPMPINEKRNAYLVAQSPFGHSGRDALVFKSSLTQDVLFRLPFSCTR